MNLSRYVIYLGLEDYIFMVPVDRADPLRAQRNFGKVITPEKRSLPVGRSFIHQKNAIFVFSVMFSSIESLNSCRSSYRKIIKNKHYQLVYEAPDPKTFSKSN